MKQRNLDRLVAHIPLHFIVKNLMGERNKNTKTMNFCYEIVLPILHLPAFHSAS